MKALLLLALFAVSSFAISAHYEELTTLWSTWKNMHNKNYDAGEEAARYAIFVNNYERIIKYNAEHPNVKLRLNKFADMTNAEFKHKQSGCAFFEDNQEIIKENTLNYGVFDPPASVDWRTKNAVTPVKNQGQCGSCWTFSTTGVLEGFHAIKNGTLLSFSEQQIVDCAEQAGQGCEGGWPYLAIVYASEQGLESEADYPYVGETKKCKYEQDKTIIPNKGYAFVNNYDPNALKAAIATMPVSVLVEADQDVFQYYSSGVVGASDGCGSSLDHAVLAVGYGSINGTDAFFIKNSWGADWGQQGYIYLSTDGTANGGAGVCGVLSQPVVPN